MSLLLGRTAGLGAVGCALSAGGAPPPREGGREGWAVTEQTSFGRDSLSACGCRRCRWVETLRVGAGRGAVRAGDRLEQGAASGLAGTGLEQGTGCQCPSEAATRCKPRAPPCLGAGSWGHFFKGYCKVLSDGEFGFPEGRVRHRVTGFGFRRDLSGPERGPAADSRTAPRPGCWPGVVRTCERESGSVLERRRRKGLSVKGDPGTGPQGWSGGWRDHTRIRAWLRAPHVPPGDPLS